MFPVFIMNSYVIYFWYDVMSLSVSRSISNILFIAVGTYSLTHCCIYGSS